MAITISKKKYNGKVFYRVKNSGVYLYDFKTKAEAKRYAERKRKRRLGLSKKY